MALYLQLSQPLCRQKNPRPKHLDRGRRGLLSDGEKRILGLTTRMTVLALCRDIRYIPNINSIEW